MPASSVPTAGSTPSSRTWWWPTPTGGPGTICLAITPAMKVLGVKNRCRVFEIPGSIEYTMATPRMRRYMEVSAQINSIYMRYISPDDMHVYSIDECFIDATPYLRLYHMAPRQLAEFLRTKAMEETGITATAGIGPNLFLAKVALDIEAKKAADGIGVLDEESFKREIWFHHPITDIWQVGPGIARRLARRGVQDLAGVCAADPKWIKKELGKSGEYLIDHAWRQEPCTIGQIKEYRPSARSISNGQVLMRDYSFGEARTVLTEMTDASCLDLCAKGLSCGGVAVHVGYAQPNPDESGRWAMGTGGQAKLANRTDSLRLIQEAALRLFDLHTSKDAPIRRLSVSIGELRQARFDQTRMQMRGASKLCVAFGNLQDEESWMVANRVIRDCELTIASARAALERMKLEVYGNDASANPQRANS